MKRQLIQALLVGSFGAMALSAGAQNATPRELAPGSSDQPGTTQNATPQNGTPADTSPWATYRYGTDPAGTTHPPGTTSRNMRSHMMIEQMQDYMDARNACASQPVPQQEYCNNAVNQKFGSIDSKCQKLSGPALEDCLRGVDHGG